MPQEKPTRPHQRGQTNPTPSLLATALVASAVASCCIARAADGPPPAPVRPVIDVYFGTPVVDRYRYMEHLQGSDVQNWMKAQATYTRRVLDSIPGRRPLEQRIRGLIGAELQRGSFSRRGDRLFYLLLEPGTDLPKLAYREGLGATEHVLVDPAKLAIDSGHHYSLDWYSPSWNGRYVAYGISKDGSEQSVLHVVDSQTGAQLPEAIDRTSDCVVSWRKDNRSFFYLRYPTPGPDTPSSQSEYNAVTFLHVLGQHSDGEGDGAVFGRGVSAQLDVPEGQGTYVLQSPDSPYAVAVANHNMDDSPNTYYVAPLEAIRGADTPWRRVATPDDGVTDVQLHGDRLYFQSQKGASHFQILTTAAAHPDVAHANVALPEGANVIDSFKVAADAIYVSERVGTTFRLRRVPYDGKASGVLDLPFAGSISDLATDPRLPGVMFKLQGWVKAPREMTYVPAVRSTIDTGLIPISTLESNDLEAHDEFATSYDGTRVPISIIARKGITLDGSHPTIVFGYGSYGLSMDPVYRPEWRAWVEHGGIVAVSHVRGGGEYGEAWHHAGQKLTKINTIFDFIESARYLIDRGYSQSRYLAASSASAGGIVMGGALEFDPGLFRVVLDDAGLSDTLRFETEPNGPPNVPEMGSSLDEAGFRGLYAMSAYAHIHDETPYPAAMFTTGTNDPRVSPSQMLKMAARLQAATTSGRPVLLRIDYNAGHGTSSSVTQRASQLADEWSFAFWQMQQAGFQPEDASGN